MNRRRKPSPAIKAAVSRINAQVDLSFVSLERNRGMASKADAFAEFLAQPGTLTRDSLIVRCRFDGQSIDIQTIVDKAVSRKRIRNGLRPCLARIRPRLVPGFDVFMLISDTMYVEEGARAEFVDFLEHVPFMRPDWKGGDPVSSGTLAMPDLFMQEPAYGKEVVRIARAAAQRPFEGRKDVIFWRGGLSGPDYPDINNCPEFPRYHLLLQTLNHPDILDVRLTHYENLARTPAGRALRRRLNRWFGGLAPFLPMHRFSNHKYLLSLDGVAASWKRVAAILWTGSVLLMQNRWQQFFYPGLVAGEHYLPVANDASDLATQFAWLTANPSQAAAIARTGQDFARHILSASAVDDHLCKLLNRCAHLR